MAGRRLQITLQPGVLRWARERAGISPEELARKLQVKPERVLGWEKSGRISIAQTDNLAKSTYTPLGFLYLAEPPTDQLPIPDFRTRRERGSPPSPDLLETIQSMQRRQSWMRDELIAEGAEPLDFIGAWGTDDSPPEVARAMRDALRLAGGWVTRESTWTDALRRLRDQAEHAGVLVVRNSVVGNNTHRKLDPGEFQGFALVDEYAPLVFVNGADSEKTQMFTLAHELAHLLVGETGVSRFQDFRPADHATEQFCSWTAAGFLVPESELQAFWPTARQTTDPYQAIARHSELGFLMAVMDTIDAHFSPAMVYGQASPAYCKEEDDKAREDRDKELYKEWYKEWRDEIFWSTQKWRVGSRFGSAVVRAVKEGRLLYREAYNLTSLRGDTFEMLRELEARFDWRRPS